METELDDRGLPEGEADKPVAGYLYFPVGQTKATSIELVYQHSTELGPVRLWCAVYVAAMLIRRGFQSAVLYAGGVIALTLLVLVVSGIRRISTAADYVGWQKHQGVGILSVQLGWSFIVSLLAIALSGVYVAIELNRDGRRVRSR